MCIEKLIETNTNEVMNLTAAIRDLIATLGNQVQTTEAKVSKPRKSKAEQVEPEPVPEPAPAPAPEAEEITIDSLKETCLKIVRAKPEMKERIKELISSFGGAKLLQDVPKDNLPELAKLLREAE